MGGEGRGQEQPAKLFTTKRGKFPISTLYDFLFHCLHGMLEFEIRIFLFSALKIEQYNFKSSPFDPHTCFFPSFFQGQVISLLTQKIYKTPPTNNSLDRVPQYSKSCPTHSLSYMFSFHL